MDRRENNEGFECESVIKMRLCINDIIMDECIVIWPFCRAIIKCETEGVGGCIVYCCCVGRIV